MNKEELFRQALQRQNDRAKGMKMPDDMEQKVMRRIKTKRAAHRWLFPLSIAAVAACLALLMTFHYLYNKVEPKKEVVVAQKMVKELPVVLPKEQPMKVLPVVKGKKGMTKTTAKRPRTKTRRKEIPDTLGNGIWQHKENVVRAMKILADCEATIMREEQEVRNAVVKATFNATPQPAGIILVSNEAGDYEVISTRTIIEL